MIARLMGLAVISPRDVLAATHGGTAAIFDVNSRETWRAAHVPGASPLDPAAFAAVDLPNDRVARLVFYCSGPLCRKAPNAARRARGFGYANVAVMSAGISGWVSAKLPVEAGERS